MGPPDRHNLEVEVEEAFVLYGAQQHAPFPQVNSQYFGFVYHVLVPPQCLSYDMESLTNFPKLVVFVQL